MYRFAIFLILFFVTASAFGAGNSVEEWLQAIEKSDAKKLSAFISPTISVELPLQSGTFSKSQAVMVLADFFKLHPAESVHIRNSGTTGVSTNFYIGDYKSGNIVYRLYVLMNNSSGVYLIHSLSITKK